jgi:hypothetical protein
MNLQQLHEILIVNEKKLSKFETKISLENYRMYFFSLFEDINKIYTYKSRPTNEKFTAKFKDFQEKKQKLILIEIWNKAINEINSKNLNIGYLKFETILKRKKIEVTNKYIIELLSEYVGLLISGETFHNSREKVYISLENLNEPQEFKDEFYSTINNLISIVNETLTNIGININ